MQLKFKMLWLICVEQYQQFHTPAVYCIVLLEIHKKKKKCKAVILILNVSNFQIKQKLKSWTVICINVALYSMDYIFFWRASSAY